MKIPEDQFVLQDNLSVIDGGITILASGLIPIQDQEEKNRFILGTSRIFTPKHREAELKNGKQFLQRKLDKAIEQGYYQTKTEEKEGIKNLIDKDRLDEIVFDSVDFFLKPENLIKTK